MKQRLAIIDHVGSKAGMDYYCGQLAKHVGANGAECLLISNFDLVADNVSVCEYFDKHSSSKLRKVWNQFAGFFRAALKCKTAGYKEAQLHIFSYEAKDVYAFMIMRLFGVRIAAVVHDVESFSKSSQRYSRLMLHKLSHKLVVHNQFSYQQLLSLHGANLADKTAIIPHGNFHYLPDANITRDEARRKLGLDTERFYLLFFGQIKSVKGLDILLEAMKHVPQEIHLVIAGKTWQHDFESYEQTINASLGGRVKTIIRFIPDSERELLYKACNVMVLPYRRIFQSGVLLMAMSYQIPVIASNLPANSELIRDGANGYLFRTEDARDLAAKIIDAVANPSHTQSLAIDAWKATGKTHSWDYIAKVLLAFIFQDK